MTTTVTNLQASADKNLPAIDSTTPLDGSALPSDALCPCTQRRPAAEMVGLSGLRNYFAHGRWRSGCVQNCVQTAGESSRE